jgi:hypothetical protein
MADSDVTTEYVKGRAEDDVLWLLYVALGIVTYELGREDDDEEVFREGLALRFKTALELIHTNEASSLASFDLHYIREAYLYADAVYKIEWGEKDDS